MSRTCPGPGCENSLLPYTEGVGITLWVCVGCDHREWENTAADHLRERVGTLEEAGDAMAEALEREGLGHHVAVENWSVVRNG